jgi:hypothetical protein
MSSDPAGHVVRLFGAEIEALNRWTIEGPGRLVLHPNRPGEPPVRVRFPDLSAAGKTQFHARVRTRNPRCPPTIVRLQVAPGDHGPGHTLDEITVHGDVDREWTASFAPLADSAVVTLTCRLSPAAETHRYSAVLLEDPILTGGDDSPTNGVPVARTMFDAGLDEYFTPREGEPTPTWVFHHIPKTAGSSLFTELGRALRPSLGVTRTPLSPFPTVAAALDHHLPEIGAGTYRFVTGHFQRPEIELMRAQTCPIGVFTVLREPVSRVVSDYRYMVTPTHPGYEDVRAQFPTLAAYLASKGQRDKMFRALRRGRSDTVEEVIADIEATYAFVGITEAYPLSRRALFKLIGANVPGPPLQSNRTQEIAENQINWRAHVDEIRAANANDVRLYQHFRARFDAVREPLRSYLASDKSLAGAS